MPAPAVPNARRRQALAVLIALLTAVLAGPAAALAALPAAAAPNVAVFTVSPANPSQTDAVTLTVTIDGCGGEAPWNVYYLVEARPYYLPDRENARYDNGVLTNDGDTWTASVTLPAGSLEAGAYDAKAYGIGPTCFTNGGQFLDSNTVLVSVPQISTTASAVAPATAVAGDTVQVDVAVNPTSATGPVTIRENGTTLGSGTVSGGTAREDAGPLTAGSHDLVATFGGNRNYGASTSTPMHIVVAHAPSPLTVVATPSPSVRFQDVTVDVTAPASADGTFEVSEGGVVLSSGSALVDGVGSAVLDDLRSGLQDLLVTYSGSTEHLPSTASVSVVVNRAASPLSVTATPTDAVRFESVLLNVAAPATADGTFEVSEGGVVLSSGSALVDGVGSAVLDDLRSGLQDLLVTYSGSTEHLPSTASVSVVVNVDVARAVAPLTVTATPSSVLRGDWFEVLVEAAGSSGTLTISDNGVMLSDDYTLSDGSGQASFSHLPVGVHELLVSYGGSADYEPSTATTTVTIDLRPTTTSLDATRDGSQLTLSADVQPDADWHNWVEGSVQFTDGDVVLGTAELSSGVAELVVPSAAVGSHQLQAHYLGDDTTGPSDSTVATAIVPGITVPTTATAGEPMRVQATGFAPGSDVDVLLGGGRLATLVADTDRVVDGDVGVPITASGRLVLALRGEDVHGEVVLVQQDITVAAAPPAPGAPDPTPVASHVAAFLARTGPTEPLTLALAGLLSLLVGATLVAQARAGRL